MGRMGTPPDESAVSISVSNRARRGTLPRGCLFAFFLVFFLAGLAALWVTLVWPLHRSILAQSWIPVPCTILSSDVVTEGDGDTYRVKIVYTYDVAGRRYQSDRYHFFSASSSGHAGKAAVVAKYPPGSKQSCFVDPDDPSQAVLMRGLPSECWFSLMAVPFLLVGGGGLAYQLGLFGRRTGPGQSESNTAPSGLRPGGELDARAGLISSPAPGPVVLRPTLSPVMKFVGILLFALFWNGIISVFVWDVVDGFRRGQPEWFQALFMTPFAIVGAGSLAAAAYTGLAIFTPRPELTVSSAEIPLGQATELKWQFRGSTRSIRRFRIVLEGKEEARYRRGTSTTTDTATFAEVPIVDETLPLRIEAGQTSLRIPTDTMHSFSGTNNKISWSLGVYGEIGFWPDVKAAFPIEVLPHLGRPGRPSGVEPAAAPEDLAGPEHVTDPENPAGPEDRT